MPSRPSPISDTERDRFDGLVDEAVEALPPAIRRLLDEVPLIVIDEPTGEMLRDLGIDPGDHDARGELCGLHSGTPYTDPAFDAPPTLPGTIHVFRRGIVTQAGGWGATRDDGLVFEDGEADDRPPDDRVYEEIMITILHEIGHQFGLDEDDLERLGYQ
jgi:predicted Zn-dependent protease with MMP-like domain